MAGNGDEWTNNVDFKPDLLSDLDETAPADTPIVQRGRSYKRKDHPFLFKTLKESDAIPSPHLNETDPATSFRVVLNPNE